MWRRRLAPALAACALGVDAAGQPEFEVRPIYYAMLEAAESSFSAHSDRLEGGFRATRDALARSAALNFQRLQTEGKELERARLDGETAVAVERDALGARIEVLNETLRHLELAREDAGGAIEPYREAFDRVLAELRVAQSRYRELGALVQDRREALDGAARAYREGSSADTKEIGRLDRAYRQFIAQVTDAFRESEAALRLEKERHTTWLEEGIEHLGDGQRNLAVLAEQYAALNEDHDRVQQELNRRIETYNERVKARTDDYAEGDASPVLRQEIAKYRELLDGHRERAVALVREVAVRRADLEAAHTAFEEERLEREEALRLRTRTLVSEQQEFTALMEARRAEVQEKIQAVESRVRTGIAALRAEVEAAEQRMTEEFGSAPANLLAAAVQWTQTLDPSHLYGPDGAPRFDRAPPGSASLYDAVDAARGLDEGVDGVLGQHLAAVLKQIEEIVAERERLVGRHRASASALAERSAAWQARLDAAKRESRRVASAHAEYFEGRLALAGLDLQALQGALLDVLEAPVMAGSDPGERERLQALVAEQAAMLGTVIEIAPTPVYPLVKEFAETGRDRPIEPQDLEWQHLGAEYLPRESAPEEQLLAGEIERRLLAAWYRRLGTARTLDPLAHRLAHHFPSYSASNLEDALYGLFETGMRNAGEVVRFHWGDGKTAYQIRILERSYWVQPDGRLLLTPLTW